MEKFAVGTPPAICELCCEYFAGELRQEKQKKITGREWYKLKQNLTQLGTVACSLLMLVGNALFFSMAIWFVPHPESPFKRRQRLLNEAFAEKLSVQAAGSQIEASYRFDVANFAKDAEAALAPRLADIRADEEDHKSRNYEDWKCRQHEYRQREELLRRRVEEVYQDQLHTLQLKYEGMLNEQRDNEKDVDNQLREARRSAYG